MDKSRKNKLEKLIAAIAPGATADYPAERRVLDARDLADLTRYDEGGILSNLHRGSSLKSAAESPIARVAVGQLNALMRDPDAYVRSWAIMAAGPLGDETSVEFLEQVAKDKFGNVDSRMRAIKGLAQIGGQQATRILLEVIESAEIYSVREHAIECLRGLAVAPICADQRKPVNWGFNRSAFDTSEAAIGGYIGHAKSEGDDFRAELIRRVTKVTWATWVDDSDNSLLAEDVLAAAAHGIGFETDRQPITMDLL